MEKIIKMINLNKYLTAIRAANALHTATYVAVATLTLLKVVRVYKAMAK
ncbi:MAG: hypothetical protein IJI67_06295 [Clostridia bacterium]|nr:hypothetical protein [Clostridia bacterium]